MKVENAKLSLAKKRQIVKKVLEQDKKFSTRLHYANKMFREIRLLMNIKCKPIEGVIRKIQYLKGKIK